MTSIMRPRGSGSQFRHWMCIKFIYFCGGFFVLCSFPFRWKTENSRHHCSQLVQKTPVQTSLYVISAVSITAPWTLYVELVLIFVQYCLETLFAYTVCFFIGLGTWQAHSSSLWSKGFFTCSTAQCSVIVTWIVLMLKLCILLKYVLMPGWMFAVKTHPGSYCTANGRAVVNPK